MITQTNTKRETINKYKYLQSKEQQTLNKQLEQKRKIEKENKKISKNKELSEKYLEKTDDYNFITCPDTIILESIKDIVEKALEKGYYEKDIQS